MIPFLVIAVAMLVIACAWVLVPLLSSRRASTLNGEAANLSILREQRSELEADLANGVISQEQHDAARSELERRVLDDVSPVARARPPESRTNAWTAALVGAGLPVTAVLLYVVLGTPAALLDGVHPGTADAQKRTSPQEIDAMIERVKERLAARPDDVDGWKVLARTYVVLGRAPEAVVAYERASVLAPDDADILADYADAIAITQNRALEGRPEAIVERALRANPMQWKANVMAGTLAFQRGNFASAVDHWERVKAAVPAESPVTQTIDASLAEARSRAKVASAAKPPAGARITGTVALSPALAASVTPDDTVFVFARPVDGSRMPLALVRSRARELPLAFTLDDSTAMVADRKLSDHADVLVGARVSRSGQATPQPGDLEGALAAAKPGASGVEIVIDRKLP